MLINVCIMPPNFSIFKQAVVNYDEIKNFIRQQVIKVFDGKDILFSENKDQLFLCKKTDFSVFHFIF